MLTRAILDPDRRADEPKRFPDLIFQKTLVSKMQFHRTVGEQNKGWRRHCRLRHVIDLYALADRNRGALEVDVLQEAVHLAGRNALAALGSNLFQGGKDLFDAFAGVSRNE